MRHLDISRLHGYITGLIDNAATCSPGQWDLADPMSRFILDRDTYENGQYIARTFQPLYQSTRDTSIADATHIVRYRPQLIMRMWSRHLDTLDDHHRNPARPDKCVRCGWTFPCPDVTKVHSAAADAGYPH